MSWNVSIEPTYSCSRASAYLRSHRLSTQNMSYLGMESGRHPRRQGRSRISQSLEMRRNASFYRRLVPKFAQVAKPLTELLRKDVPFRWVERQQSAFANLKTALCSEQVLAYPDFSSQFILSTNVSKVAVAAILSEVEDGVERPISYASRQLNSAEQNYSPSEAEVLAVTWGTRHYRCYL